MVQDTELSAAEVFQDRYASQMNTTRRIAIVTTGRADAGLLIPVCRAIAARDDLESAFWVSGPHLNPDGSLSQHADSIADHAQIGARIVLPSVDSDLDMSRAIACAGQGFTDAIESNTPDIIVVLGDRYETLAAAIAAASCGVALVHIHGGEISTGAIDNQFRYAITALANLHCVATETARRRLIAMGESPETVVLTGAPGLDQYDETEPLSRETFNKQTGLTGDEPFLLVTLHPTTLDQSDPAQQATQLVRALQDSQMPCLITAANQDPAGRAINAVMRTACESNGWAFSESLGRSLYRSAMQSAAAMVGNSSSGIIEASTFGLPVVNIGDRQAGRERSGNVTDCAHDAHSISTAIRRAVGMDTSGITNLYGDGNASVRIASAIAEMPLGKAALRKLFDPPGLVAD